MSLGPIDLRALSVFKHGAGDKRKLNGEAAKCLFSDSNLDISALFHASNAYRKVCDVARGKKKNDAVLEQVIKVSGKGAGGNKYEYCFTPAGLISVQDQGCRILTGMVEKPWGWRSKDQDSVDKEVQEVKTGLMHRAGWSSFGEVKQEKSLRQELHAALSEHCGYRAQAWSLVRQGMLLGLCGVAAALGLKKVPVNARWCALAAACAVGYGLARSKHQEWAWHSGYFWALSIALDPHFYQSDKEVRNKDPSHITISINLPDFPPDSWARLIGDELRPRSEEMEPLQEDPNLRCSYFREHAKQQTMQYRLVDGTMMMDTRTSLAVENPLEWEELRSQIPGWNAPLDPSRSIV